MDYLERQLKAWATVVSKQRITPTIAKKLGDFSSIALNAEKKIDAYTFKYNNEGSSVAGFIVAPKARNKKLPIIIYNRGGTADFGLVPVGHLFTRFAWLAEAGYLVVGSQYPGNHLSEGKDERGGPSDVRSVLRLYDLIESLDVADESNIGMYGDSRGGMMTYLCMKEVDWIKAALTVGGLADLEHSLYRRSELRHVYKNHFGNTTVAKDQRSVIKWADKLNKNTPLCLLHGGNDDRVSVSDALNLASRLAEASQPFSLHVLMGGNHMLSNVSKERDRFIKEWFDRHLQGDINGGINT